MKKLAFIATTAAFALAACGETTDASDDAVADTVEVPADAAMADAPPPVVDEAPVVTNEQANEAMNVTEEEAEAAANRAERTVDAALDAAAAAERAQGIAADAQN